MIYSGNINKMQTTLVDGVANYQLPIGDDLVPMNDLVGKYITLEFNGQINCCYCGVLTKKSYSQGYCYPCAQNLARCDLCIMKPETCHHHLGTCREPDWGLDYCFSPHIVYLANSSGLKVGITKQSNIPSRFIDQGAVEFLPILATNSRINAGKIEHFFKDFVADKTNWRAMLKNDVVFADLLATKTDLIDKAQDLITQFEAEVLAKKVQKINYPVLAYPSKITSLNFDKTPTITGILQGIKGQYLILDCGVLNIRKFGSYHIKIDV
jgi:hypothetical protein